MRIKKGRFRKQATALKLSGRAQYYRVRFHGNASQSEMRSGHFVYLDVGRMALPRCRH